MCEHDETILKIAGVVLVWFLFGVMGDRVGRAWFALKGSRDLSIPLMTFVLGPINLLVTIILCIFDGKDERS